MAKKKNESKSLEELKNDQAKVIIVQFKSFYLLKDVIKKYSNETIESITRVFPVFDETELSRESNSKEGFDTEAYLSKNYKKFIKPKQALYRFYKFTCISAESRDQLLESFQNDKSVESAEIDPIAETNVTPNDPEYPNLWGIQKINPENVWECTKGCDVIVAVVDTGIDHSHMDLNQNMWELSPGIYGRNFTPDYGGNQNNTMDGHSHGTHVAGTIAAEGNNNYGVIGVAPRARLMAMKGLTNGGSGFFSWLANCIVQAAAWGANVVNNSWGCGGRCPNPIAAMNAAITFARAQGATIVFAAGNSNDDTQFYYPQNDLRTISVGATDSSDNRAGFSNYGGIVNVAAPGVAILSTTPGNSFASYSGTSMSAPHVSGMAALILSKVPGLDPNIVQNIIESYITTITPDKPIGSGRIDLKKLDQLLCLNSLSRCDITKAICENELLLERDKKHKKIISKSNSQSCQIFQKGECITYDFPDLTPCFTLNWGDGRLDQFETHDNENIFITVCNPFSNITFKGLTITKITITPNQTLPNGDDSVEIVPSKLICYDSIEPCSCATKEYSFMTHFALPGPYTLAFAYCIDGILVEGMKSGSDEFEVQLVDS